MRQPLPPVDDSAGYPGFVDSRTDSLFWNPQGLGGSNDLQAATEINGNNGLLTPWSLLTLYQQSGLCNRIVSLPPSAAIMQAGWFVRDPSSDPDPMAEEDRRLDLRFNSYAAAVFAGIFGSGYLYVVADELDGNQDMRKPLRLDNIRRIVNLLPMTTIECTSMLPTMNALDPNYGEPDMWSCVPYPFMESRPVVTHHSRVLRFPGVTLPNRDRARNRGADQSILQAALEQIKALGILDQSVGNIAQRLHTLIYEANNLGTLLSGDQAQQFREKVALIAQVRSMFNMNVVDQGEKMTIAAAPPSGFDQLSAHAMTAVSAAVNIPRPILFEPEGGFSQGDAQAQVWAAVIKAYSERVLAPPLRRLYELLYCQQEGPIARKVRRSSVALSSMLRRDRWTRSAVLQVIHHPKPLTPERVDLSIKIADKVAESPNVTLPPAILIPETYDVQFRPLHAEDAKEQADRRLVIVGYLVKLKDAGVLLPNEIRANLFGAEGWQDEIQPLPPLPDESGAIPVTSITLQNLLIDVAKGGDVADAATLIAEEFPALVGTSAGLLEAAAKFRKTPDQAAAPDAEAPTDATAAPIPLRREVAAGGTRSGTGPDGPWSVTMPCDYGEIPGTKGLDAEPVDYLLVPEGPRGMAYVAEILLPGDEGEEPTLDEHKVILGCPDEEAATNLLSEVYGESVEIGKIIALPEGRLLAWLETSAHPSASALDAHPPDAVRDTVRQGLVWYKEGIRSNATPATVAWARRLAAGMPLSKARLRSVAAAHRLHAAPQPLTDGAPPTPAHVRHALTGGDAGREWIASLLANRTDAVPEKYSHISFEPPEGAQEEAQKGLDWRREHGRGGTAVGIARARDLARGAEISPETIGRMVSFFGRHEGDKEGKGFTPGDGFPSNGRIAWALWGGDPGRAWAEKVYRQMEAADRA